MWFFRKKEPTKALRQLQEDFAELQRRQDDLELAWSNVYGKIRTTMGRITKSAAILEARDSRENGEPPAPGGAPPSPVERPEVTAALNEIAKRRGWVR